MSNIIKSLLNADSYRSPHGVYSEKHKDFHECKVRLRTEFPSTTITSVRPISFSGKSGATLRLVSNRMSEINKFGLAIGHKQTDVHHG